jgi:hypothetical protein
MEGHRTIPERPDGFIAQSRNEAWAGRTVRRERRPAAEPANSGVPCAGHGVLPKMLKFLLWLLLFVVCWPLAILALLLWPVVWVLTLPFRLLGIAVEGVFAFLRAVVLLPARLLGGRPGPA